MIDIVTLQNYGQIQHMELPCGWQEATPERDSDVQRVERIFHPVPSIEADLVFYYRGRPTPEDVGKAFCRVLQSDPHKLEYGELGLLTRTLADLSEPDSFALREARTRDIRGKRILDVCGIWQFNQQQYHGILLDADGSGCVVQQIYLLSPCDQFELHDQQFETSLQSIIWK